MRRSLMDYPHWFGVKSADAAAKKVMLRWLFRTIKRKGHSYDVFEDHKLITNVYILNDVDAVQFQLMFDAYVATPPDLNTSCGSPSDSVSVSSVVS